MNCQHIQDLIGPFLEGRLRGEDARQIRQHLASCAACSSGLDPLDMTEILPVLDETVNPSADFETRFYARLNERRRSEPVQAVWKRFGAWNWSWRFAAAAVLTVVVAAGLYMRQPANQTPDASAVLYDLDVSENLPLLDEMALIDNLDLFEDFDTIENLPQFN